MVWINTRIATKHYNRSRQFLNQLHEKGRIKRRKVDKKVQFHTDSLDEYFGFDPYLQMIKSEECKNSNVIKIERKQRNPKLKTGKKISDTIKELNNQSINEKTGVEKDNLDSYMNTLADVDIELKKVKIEAQKLKNDVEKGKLIDREKAEKFFFETARKTRNSLESIPARISGICVGKTKHEIEQLLIEEIKRTLTNLILNI